MIVEQPGFVLTNAHVVAGAERIQVILDSASVQTLGRQTTRTVDATLVGVSDELDLALPAIDRGADLPREAGVPTIVGARERAADFVRALDQLRT